MIDLFKKGKIKIHEPLSRKEKVRLRRFADLIGKYILMIRMNARDTDTQHKLERIANIIRNIYSWDKDIEKIMNGFSDALTGNIDNRKIELLINLNVLFRKHINNN